MHDMTVRNLRGAFGGESMAHLRYKIWGAKAEAEGFPNVARLFRAISVAEEMHAGNHFRAMRKVEGGFAVGSMAGFGLGSTSRNLQGAIDGETFEVRETYPVYLNAAQLQGEKGAERSFLYALEAERIHAAMYKKAKDAVDAGKDVELGPVQICSVCGHTVEGDAPQTCPICNVGKDRFVTFA